jgi:beta-glucanase (GH16 family)
MNWSPNQITFLVDGIAYYTYNPAVKDDNTWPFDLDQFILLNVAMGGVSGAIDPNFMESAMIIDYVRVYQNVLDTDGFTKEDVKVYPNPASETLFIQSPDQILSLQLYDIQGREVYSSSEDTDFITVNAFNKGVYFLKIEGKDGFMTKKVIIK